MDELSTTTHRNFWAYAESRQLTVNIAKLAEVFVMGAVREFEQREREVGVGKTRRPPLNHKFFAECVERALEIERREREDTDRFFGNN